MEEEIKAGNKLIHVFMEDVPLQKELLDIKHLSHFHQLKYHSSWDWQVPIWGKVTLAVKSLIPKLLLSDIERQARVHWYIKLVDKYENEAIYLNNPIKGHEIIVELLTWYNTTTTQPKD